MRPVQSAGNSDFGGFSLDRLPSKVDKPEGGVLCTDTGIVSVVFGFNAGLLQ